MGSILLSIFLYLLFILVVFSFVDFGVQDRFISEVSAEVLMSSTGIQIQSVFDVLSDSDLKAYLHTGDANELIPLFSEMPQRATEFSAGYDLSVLNTETIPAHESRLIVFGNSIAINNPLVTGVVVPRSSLAKKRGLIISGGPEYIYSGSGYTCLCCKFINYTDRPVELRAGDKIAQVVFFRYPSWIADDAQVFPDPLDETFMSPVIDGNLESIALWEKSEAYPFMIDQTDLVSYNFQASSDVVLLPGKVQCIMTGIRCRLDPDQVFILKNAFINPCVELANCIGVIDADYYDNPDNGGEIGVLLLNRGNFAVTVHAGDVIASGAIYYYEKADGDIYGGKRSGGFGSTDM